jgi:TolB-like protein
VEEPGCRRRDASRYFRKTCFSSSLSGSATAERHIHRDPALRNLSPDKENEFFADGIHADLLTNLLSLRELRVTSAQTVSDYRDTKKKVSEIARELGVAYILTRRTTRRCFELRRGGGQGSV